MQRNAQFSKSKVQCLLRHRGGNYYASAKVGGKIIRRSLDTDDYNAAKLRLPAVLAEMRGARNSSEAGTLGAAIEAEANREDPAIKQTTRHYYQQIAVSLAKIAAKLPVDPFGLSIARVTLAELRALMDRYAAATSPTRYNGCLALLRRVYERAIEAGHIGANLPISLKRIRPVSLKMDLPAAESFAKVVADILAQRKSHSKATAAAVEFLAYTGLRISEAQSIRWRDIRDGFLIVRTAKNDAMRQVPLIPAALSLLARLRAVGIPTGPDDPVMLIKSPRIALDGSCARLALDHLRVHDLRHIFATRCIESGVDLPTLASWLGHKDGGVLCAQVYGHLCIKHSTAMAGKVKA
ncbi:MAG: site-specific integrase [Verrucomicrobia bacterium]|nr:site-specific integrase [Verrucomicrobiota bacterium]